MLTIGQTLSAGNMNYQQDQGMYEVNPIYGKHPSKERIYATKAGEVAALYGLAKIFPKHEKSLLKIANMVNLGFMIDDQRKGIELKFKW